MEPTTAAEGDADACPGEVVERGVNASLGAALGGGNANGTTAEGFP